MKKIIFSFHMNVFFWNLQKIQFRCWYFSKWRFFWVFWFAAVVGHRNVIARIKFSENIVCGFRHPGLCSPSLVVLVLSFPFFVSPCGVLIIRFRLRSLVFALLISSCSCRRLGLAVLVSLSPLGNFWAYPSQKRVRMMFKFLERCIDMVRSTLSEIYWTLLRRFSVNS